MKQPRNLASRRGSFSLAILCQTLITGGAQRQIVQLAKALHRQGVPVTVLAFYEGGELLDELLAANVPYVCLRKRGRWDVFGFLIRLVRTIRRCKPTAVYGFMTVPNILLTLLHPLLRPSAVVWGVRATNLRTDRYDWLVGLTMSVENVLSRHADLIISNSMSGRNDVIERGFPAERVAVVPNGLDTERFVFDAAGREAVRTEWGLARGELLVGVPARLDPMKGHPTFIRAAAKVLVSLPDARFVCVGSGSRGFEEDLRRMAYASGLGGRIIWAGTRSDMPAVYSAIDVVVSASSFGEGFSNVVGEAMACGRPCVVTDVGDSRAIVGEAGVVVPADDPDALAHAIVAICRADLECVAKSARARALSEFSVDAMVTGTMTTILGRLRTQAAHRQEPHVATLTLQQPAANFLEQLRLKELETATAWMPAGSAVLEVGAGSGWQAKRLAELGYHVSAIDVPTSNYRESRVWPVSEYDGRTIPFPAGSFDVVFSSNVLEHIEHVEAFQAELQRVLRPGGRAIHLLPTASWRLWTSLAHYVFLVKRLLSLLRPQGASAIGGELGDRARRRGVAGLIGRVLLAPRHGEAGNPLSEIYYFSRFRWTPLFVRTGWLVRHHDWNRLWYTGYAIMGSRASLAARERLSRALGSACHVYVLEKGGTDPVGGSRAD